MIITGLLVVCLCSYSQASDDEIPFVIASNDNVGGPKVSNLLPVVPVTFPQGPSSLLPTGQLPSGRGRSDIEIETEDKPFGGYVYPKPSTPFNLPTFMTLDANPGLTGGFDSGRVGRAPRSPQRRPRPPYFYPPPRPMPLPNFPTGWTYPGIRPLPALYGRPQNF